jgi:hypothetical protein
MRARIVSEASWDSAVTDDLLPGTRPFMGISVSPDATRASVALAWQQPDGVVAVDLVEDIAGDLDVDKLGEALKERQIRAGVAGVAFASWTDQQLARYLRNPKALDGKDFANASVNFARLVETGFLKWRGPASVTSDLGWVARKGHESGAWSAVLVDDTHPATSILAMIRASWLASGPPPGAPRVY